MILPCKHQSQITSQVEPTIDLLQNLDELHPDVLLEHDIMPRDYKDNLVFRSAIESIRGSFIASSTRNRQGLVASLLQGLKLQNRIDGFQKTSNNSRTDFELALAEASRLYAGLEVKGGEGNSINISDRPMWAKEFYVWSHLDGAIKNQPDHGAHSIVNRISNEMCRRNKKVDALFIKDALCGTPLKPCPKYPGAENSIGTEAAPDILLFPQEIPSLDNPEPPVHTLASLTLPSRILEFFKTTKNQFAQHVWYIHIRIEKVDSAKIRSIIEIEHEGKTVDTSKSRAWHI